MKMQENCNCGKTHIFDSEVIVKAGAIGEIPRLLAQFGAKKVFLIADQNTYAAAGAAVAALVGLLGIRIVGIASDHGDLQQMAKSRGDKRAMADMVKIMKDLGYQGGKVLIHHCENPEAAAAFEKKIHADYPAAHVVIDTTNGLCSFYAEDGGMLVGFETA